jgi:signal transduction histidine kinase
MSFDPSDRVRHPFSLRLASWYALLFLGGSLALVGITYVLLAVTLRQHDRDIVESTLVRFAAAYTRAGTDGLAREIQRAQVAGPAGPLFVRILNRRQDLVFVSMPERWRAFDYSQLSTPSLAGGAEWATLETGSDDGDSLEVLSVRLGDGTIFQVGKSTERREELLRRFRRVLLFNLGSILVVAIVGGAVLTRSALQPVRALAETIRRIMRTGRTSERVPDPAPGDPIGDLASLVNAMLDRIDAVVSGMRGALDNVGHDLRTPMARLRSTAESALSSNDPVTLRNALAECIEESDRIIAMLNTLMDISEAETGTMALRVEDTALSDLLAQTVDLYEDVAEEAGVQIRTSADGDLRVQADRNRMRQVLSNLLDNAIKYTPRGGSVDIAAVRDADQVVITVRDSGVGIPQEELPHVWSRLFRGDRSRSTRGLGLGLSLVKAIVEAHRGSATIESTPGQGTTVEVRLPEHGRQS